VGVNIPNVGTNNLIGVPTNMVGNIPTSFTTTTNVPTNFATTSIPTTTTTTTQGTIPLTNIPLSSTASGTYLYPNIVNPLNVNPNAGASASTSVTTTTIPAATSTTSLVPTSSSGYNINVPTRNALASFPNFGSYAYQVVPIQNFQGLQPGMVNFGPFSQFPQVPQITQNPCQVPASFFQNIPSKSSLGESGYIRQTRLSPKKERKLCKAQLGPNNWRSAWCDQMTDQQANYFDDCYNYCLDEQASMRYCNINRNKPITGDVADLCAALCFDSI
jgi:hypothetical protein